MTEPAFGPCVNKFSSLSLSLLAIFCTFGCCFVSVVDVVWWLCGRGLICLKVSGSGLRHGNGVCQCFDVFPDKVC